MDSLGVHGGWPRDPIRPALDSKLAREHAEKLHTSLIDRARKQRDEARKQSEEDFKRKKEAEEKLLKETPAKILKELVRATVVDLQAAGAEHSSAEDVEEGDSAAAAAPGAGPSVDAAEHFGAAVRQRGPQPKVKAKAKAEAEPNAAPRASSSAPNQQKIRAASRLGSGTYPKADNWGKT